MRHRRRVKIGDKVKIEKDDSGHGFKIGSEVTISIIDDESYGARQEQSHIRYMESDEFTLI